MAWPPAARAWVIVTSPRTQARACLTIGYIFGEAIVGLVGDLVLPLGVLEPMLGLTILLFWLVRARRSTPHLVASGQLSRASRVRVGALAGALSIAGCS
jgi:hypothetical protein